MQKLGVQLENCYGIKSLDATFDFSERHSYVIYAPNGVMKTSFAQTFKDLSEGQDSCDRIFKEKVAKRLIVDENGAELDAKAVFVVEPYNKDYKSERISTLLVNKALKEKYDQIHRAIDEKKESLTKELKKLSGLKNDVEGILADTIVFDSKEFFKALNSVRPEVENGKQDKLSDVKYQSIFNDKVLAVIESKDFREKLKEYIEIYDKLLSSSTFFRKGIFNHNNAADIAKTLKSNGWFEATHTVNINADNKKREILTEAELTEVIDQEKQSILENPALAKSFEDIDKKLTKNADLRDFRSYIEQNKFILPELDNLNRLKRKLWIAYLIENKEAFDELLKEYDAGKEEIEKIVQSAKEEATKWRDVINIFNERFSVPFVVNMANQDDVILKSEAPTIKFEFKDSSNDTKISVEEEDLLRVLSNGEKRALYILNIIFEVEARKEEQQQTVFVVDDIADSFDYKNKYAIIEYLKDISNEGIFYQIILTHNFDFYRTISSRLDLKRENKLHTVKTEDSIKLIQEKYQKNPFHHWKENLATNNEMLIASIPFVRNLAEYCGFDDHFKALTSLLHIKSDTDQITIGDLEKIIKEILKDVPSLNLSNKTNFVKATIYSTADQIFAETEEVLELEKKIVLSIAIRLKTEEFLIKKINDQAFTSGITSNQTFKLIEKYKEKFPTDLENIKLAEQVNLMTPENIHVNSFMYEPILDMSNEHLKRLYQRVSGASWTA